MKPKCFPIEITKENRMKSNQIERNLKPSEINIEISDVVVLTPLSCATIVNEILKNLLYQRSQIPYTYNHLKSVIDRKRANTKNNGINNNNNNKRSTNFNLTNQYRIVSNFYDNLELLMVNLCNLFKLSTTVCIISEVLFVLGTTPICPKEIFRIRINDVVTDGRHVENYHLLECKKNQHKVLRNIFLSETWIESTMNASVLSCTNFYLFLKTRRRNIETILGNDTILMPCRPLMFNSNNTKHFTVNLTIDKNQKYNCCNNLGIFSDDDDDDEQELLSSSPKCIDTSSSSTISGTKEQKEEEEEFWFQSKISLQGFKDCFINKISASELW